MSLPPSYSSICHRHLLKNFHGLFSSSYYLQFNDLALQSRPSSPGFPQKIFPSFIFYYSLPPTFHEFYPYTFFPFPAPPSLCSNCFFHFLPGRSIYSSRFRHSIEHFQSPSPHTASRALSAYLGTSGFPIHFLLHGLEQRKHFMVIEQRIYSSIITLLKLEFSQYSVHCHLLYHPGTHGDHTASKEVKMGSG